MTIEQLINVLVTLTLVEMMLAIGLRVTPSEVLTIAKDWPLVLRAGWANYILVPITTVGLLLLLDTPPLVAAGFLILAACPGAPYGPPLAATAKGDLSCAVGLMVILAGSSAILAPLVLGLLLPWFSRGQSIEVNTGRLLTTLLATQLLPLCAGIAARQFQPMLATHAEKICRHLSKTLNLLTISAIIGSQFQDLSEIRLRGVAGMLLLTVASWLIGWLCGGPIPSIWRTMVVTTALRNIGVGLVLATSTFAGTTTSTAVVAHGLVSLLATLALSILMRTVVRTEPDRKLPHAWPESVRTTTDES